MSSVSLYGASFRSARGYIDGFIMANGTDTDHDINFGAGLAAANADDSTELYSSGTLVKQIDATWAVGTNQGGLFTGTVTNDTWYHCFIIKNPTTGVVDCGFDTSVTAANIPATYTKYRRVGSVLTDGSANIYAFKQLDNCFRWDTAKVDASSAAIGTDFIATTLSVPTGVVVRAIMSVGVFKTSGGPYIVMKTPTITEATLTGIARCHDAVFGFTFAEEYTNTSAQVSFKASVASSQYLVNTMGWHDPRGRNV